MIPRTININTAGIFVFLESPLKRNEIMIVSEMPIIRLYEVKISISGQFYYPKDSKIYYDEKSKLK